MATVALVGATLLLPAMLGAAAPPAQITAPVYSAEPCCKLCPRAADPSVYVTRFMRDHQLTIQGVDDWLFRTEVDLTTQFPVDEPVIAGLARTGGLYVASIPVISMWNISFPAAQGMMTHRVSEREQGELQGAIQSLRSIAFVVGPFLFSGIFAWFINPKHSFYVPGAPYYLAAALLFTAMLLATRVEQPQFGEASPTPDASGEAMPAIGPIVDTEENI